MGKTTFHTERQPAYLSRRRFLGGGAVALAGAGLTTHLGFASAERKGEDAGSEITGPRPDVLIKDGFIATMDERRTVHRRGSLYIKDGRIVEIGPRIDTPSDPGIVIDARNKVILPGFVNTHAHLQQYFRGTYELIGDFYQVNLPLEGYRSPEDMDTMGSASCAEFLYGGCTTALVIYTYPDGFARAAAKAGNRCVLAADIEEIDLNRLRQGEYVYLPKKGEAAFGRAKALYENWHGKSEGLITTCLCPKAPDLVRPETYRRVKAFAREHGLRITTHLAQTWREMEQVKKLYGKTSVRHLMDMGLLDDVLTGVHCDYITARDLQLILDSGMGILHCRSVENPLLQWIDLGIPVGLGTDDYHHDMLPLLRQNLTGQRARARGVGGFEGRQSGNRMSRRPTYYDLLELATRKGAEAIGMGKRIGSLEKGKRADIITFDMNNPYLTPTKDPLTSIVLYGSSRDIDNVFVDGRRLKADGRMTTIDMPKALAEAREKAEEIIAGFFREHPAQKTNWERMAPYMK